MSSDDRSLCKFEDGWEQVGIGKDGMPKMKPRLFISFSKPPHYAHRREAEEEDIEANPEAYKVYQKIHAARDVENIEGYPLALWSAITKAEFEQMASNGIMTIEQLAKIAERRGAVAAKVPEMIMLLAQRAKRMVELQKNQGQFEEIISELTNQRDTMQAELFEARTQLSAANAVIQNMQARIAGIGTLLPERAA